MGEDGCPKVGRTVRQRHPDELATIPWRSAAACLRCPVEALSLAPAAGSFGVPSARAGPCRVVEEQVALWASAAPQPVGVERAELLDEASGQRRRQRRVGPDQPSPRRLLGHGELDARGAGGGEGVELSIIQRLAGEDRLGRVDRRPVAVGAGRPGPPRRPAGRSAAPTARTQRWGQAGSARRVVSVIPAGRRGRPRLASSTSVACWVLWVRCRLSHPRGVARMRRRGSVDQAVCGAGVRVRGVSAEATHPRGPGSVHWLTTSRSPGSSASTSSSWRSSRRSSACPARWLRSPPRPSAAREAGNRDSQIA
jgi:hypothetical protein